MDAALYHLLFLRMRGGVRHRISQLASLRGLMFLVIVAGIIWLLMRAGGELPADGLNGPGELRDHIRNFMPLGLLAASLFTVLVTTGPAIHFSQNEINFLFPGPFSRRGLVIYKLSAYFAGALVSAAIISLLIPPRASTGIAAFAGCLLTLLFTQLSSAALGLTSQVFETSWLARVKRPAMLGVMALACATVLFLAVATDKSALDQLAGFRNSWPGTIILAPFAVFAEIFIAQEVFPGLAMWVAVAIAINLCLFVAILMLDSRTSERSFAESSRNSNRWLRVRQGGSMWASDRTTSRSVRRSPRFGGVGPIAWRQAINAVRNSGRVIAVFLGIAMLTGPLLAATGMLSSTSSTMGMLYFFIAFILPRTLVCDFRGELGRMETYKALPIAPWRICAGQLAIPVILSSLVQLLMVLSALAFLDRTSAAIMAATILFILPFNLLLYGLENLVFLLFPAKLVPVGRVDFDFLGRALVDFTLKTIIIVTVLAAARTIGIIAQRATGEFWFSFVLASWSTVTIAGLLIIPIAAFAFRRFKLGQTIE